METILQLHMRRKKLSVKTMKTSVSCHKTTQNDAFMGLLFGIVAGFAFLIMCYLGYSA